VHRDIKPANVMVGRYGEVVLMDWGIAKPSARRAIRPPGRTARSRATRRARPDVRDARGSVIGTPAYMSPEQARGENDRIDERSDLYSAAVVFQELISQRHYLADKQSLEAMLDGVIKDEVTVTTLSEIRAPGTPMELIHFVREGLTKDPAKRFPVGGGDDREAPGDPRGQGAGPVSLHPDQARRPGARSLRGQASVDGVQPLAQHAGALVFAAVMLVRIVIPDAEAS